VKSSIQARRKGRILLVKVDEICRSVWLEHVSLLLELASSPRFGILLPGKYEDDIPAFVADRHSVREGVLASSPPDIHSQRLIHPSPGRIGRLVAECLNHPEQLRLRPFARHTSDETDDTRHRLLAQLLLHDEIVALPGIDEAILLLLGDQNVEWTIYRSKNS